MLLIRFFPEGKAFSTLALREKFPNTAFFSGPYFLVFGTICTQNMILRKIFHPIRLMAETFVKNRVHRGPIPSNFPKFPGEVFFMTTGNNC